MDLMSIDVKSNDEASVPQPKINELLELQLALVGGGIGNCELG
jgi:hypothetical protein